MNDSFGKYDIYAVSESRYCYSGTAILRNRLGIKDKALLHQLEADISAFRQTEMILVPVPGRFTANHLCRIHKSLLGDIYPFAGHYRKEDIAKGETRFLPYIQIETKLHELLRKLKEENFLLNNPRNECIKRDAWYMAELNFIHPFREGNGRATREFMRLLFLKQGFSVNWAAVSVDELLQAMVESIYETEHLEQVLQICLTNK